MLSLTILNSDNMCSVFELDSAPGSVYSIGRSAECDIALTDEIHLSRVHCILTIGMDCVLITDNNSSNGIFEDGNRVSEIAAVPGKSYRIGNCDISFEYKEDTPTVKKQPEVNEEKETPRDVAQRTHDRNAYDDEPQHRDKHDRKNEYDDEPRHHSHRTRGQDYYDDEPRHHSHRSHGRDYYDDEPRHHSHRSHARDDYDDDPQHHSYRSRERDYYDDEPRHHSHRSHERDYYDDEPRHHSHRSHERDYYDDEPRHHSHRSHERIYYDDEPRLHSHRSHERDYYDDEPRHHFRRSHERDYYDDEPRHHSRRPHERDYYDDEPRHHSHRSHERDYYDDEPRHHSRHPYERDYYDDEPRHRPHRSDERDCRSEEPRHTTRKKQSATTIYHQQAPTNHCIAQHVTTVHQTAKTNSGTKKVSTNEHTQNVKQSTQEYRVSQPKTVPHNITQSIQQNQQQSLPPQIVEPIAPQISKKQILKLIIPESKTQASTGRKFVPPPPRKALVKRVKPRPFYTAAGKLNTETELAPPKELKHRRPVGDIRLLRAPSSPAVALGLPNDFALELQLLNTTETLEEGDLLRFSAMADANCHVFLIQYDSEKNGVVLVPGVGGAVNYIQAAEATQFPPQDNTGKYELYVEPPFGRDTILAIACTMKVDFVKIWQKCLTHADSLTSIGEVERQAIKTCREIKGMENARWAAALLHIETGS